MFSAICFNLDQSKILLSGNGGKKTFETYRKKWTVLVTSIVFFPTNVFLSFAAYVCSGSSVVSVPDS